MRKWYETKKRSWLPVTIFAVDRAQDVALSIIDTCDGLDQHATEDERNDAVFCAELDSRVMRCESCGWWRITAEISADGLCAECDGEGDDERHGQSHDA